MAPATHETEKETATRNYIENWAAYRIEEHENHKCDCDEENMCPGSTYLEDADMTAEKLFALFQMETPYDDMTDKEFQQVIGGG